MLGSLSSGVCAPGSPALGAVLTGLFLAGLAGDLTVRGPCQGLKWVQLCHILAVPAPHRVEDRPPFSSIPGR